MINIVIFIGDVEIQMRIQTTLRHNYIGLTDLSIIHFIPSLFE